MERSEGHSKETLFFVISFGLIVLLQMSWQRGFFADGYLYSLLGKNALNEGHWLVPHISDNTTSKFTHHSPFLFMIEGAFFGLFGSSYSSARMFVSLFTMATGLSLFFVSKKENLKNHAPAIITIILFIIPPLLKKSRFPNLDIPLMLTVFWGVVFYFKSLEKSCLKSWLLCGLLFGISSLIKGPIAFLIPIIIFVHLLLNKKLTVLLDYRPWLSLFGGFLIFLIWPLSLSLAGQFDVFRDWFDFTFLITIKDGRQAPSPFYTYFLFLLKNTGPLFLIVIFHTLKNYKKIESQFVRLSIVSFWTILLVFSIPKFKYSNYLIPLYPFMAIIVGDFLCQYFKDKMPKVLRYFRYFVVVAALVLLIFPLTTKTRRDREIFSLKNTLSLSQYKPSNWLVVNHSYPYWSLLFLNIYEDNIETFNVDRNSLDEKLNNSVVLVKSKDLGWFKDIEKIKNHYYQFGFMKKYDLYIFIPLDSNKTRFFHF